jgi:hypothetical protein
VVKIGKILRGVIKSNLDKNAVLTKKNKKILTIAVGLVLKNDFAQNQVCTKNG